MVFVWIFQFSPYFGPYFHSYYPSRPFFCNQNIEQVPKCPLQKNLQPLNQSTDSRKMEEPFVKINADQQIIKQEPEFLKVKEGVVQQGRNEEQKPKRAKRQKRNKDDYNPNSNPKKKTKKITQNIFRNVLPNVVHQIFCFIQMPQRSGQMVTKLLQLNSKKDGLTPKRFYLYQKLIKNKINHYINESSLKELSLFQQLKCEIYSLQEQQIYLRISRILAKHFLNNEFKAIALTSSRMKAQSRKYHLDVRRMLLNKLNILFKSNRSY